MKITPPPMPEPYRLMDGVVAFGPAQLEARDAAWLAIAQPLVDALAELELFVRVSGLDSQPAAQAAANARAALQNACKEVQHG